MYEHRQPEERTRIGRFLGALERIVESLMRVFGDGGGRMGR